MEFSKQAEFYIIKIHSTLTSVQLQSDIFSRKQQNFSPLRKIRWQEISLQPCSHHGTTLFTLSLCKHKVVSKRRNQCISKEEERRRVYLLICCLSFIYSIPRLNRKLKKQRLFSYVSIQIPMAGKVCLARVQNFRVQLYEVCHFTYRPQDILILYKHPHDIGCCCCFSNFINIRSIIGS